MAAARAIVSSIFAALVAFTSDLANAAATQFVQASATASEFRRSGELSVEPAEIDADIEARRSGRYASRSRIRLDHLARAARQDASSGGSARTASAGKQSAAGGTAPSDPNVPAAPPAKKRGWVGLEVGSIDERRARELGLPSPAGAEIVAIIGYGPGGKAGLRQRDVVVEADGAAIVDHAHFIRTVSALPPGATISLSIMRDGKHQAVTIRLGNFFDDHWHAAHRGDPTAMLNLGLIYTDHDMVAQDYRKSFQWIRKAAEAGNVKAMAALGSQYLYGRGVARDDRQGVFWYRKAADAGDPDSMFALGLFHYRGQGVARDYVEAARWYERAIDKGHARAMHNYGNLLQDGLGVEKNEAQAVDYFRRAAQLGFAGSFPAVGEAYYAGRGVNRDLREAERWYREGAKRGVSTGLAGMGMLYERGEGGLAKDMAEAAMYYRKAAEAGDEFALQRLRELDLSVHDPKEAQRLLSELGFDPGPIDGQPGPKTKQAIRDFQRSHGLTVNGEDSLQLIGQLRAALKQGKAAPKPAEQTKRAEPAGSPELGKVKDLKDLDSLQ